ncbi:MAG: PAS domain-containing protein [Propionibacteriaceae bacterium]|nr:PAS domain-containing protein [Propionibacteriaceae bacterium]
MTAKDLPHIRAVELSASQSAERDGIMATLAQLVEPLARVLPGSAEVVLHDLARLPHSIIALEGTLTGRCVGGPATDMLLQSAVRGDLTTRIGYTGHGIDGQELRCSTLIFRTSQGTPVAALCINCDTSGWRIVASLASAMLPDHALGGDSQGSAEQTPAEHFVGDVDELADDLIVRAIASLDVPVPLMQKRHKMAVVSELKSSGFFILRESVERAASALGVTRFTVYNYLKELDRDHAISPDAADHGEPN